MSNPQTQLDLRVTNDALVNMLVQANMTKLQAEDEILKQEIHAFQQEMEAILVEIDADLQVEFDAIAPKVEAFANALGSLTGLKVKYGFAPRSEYDTARMFLTRSSYGHCDKYEAPDAWRRPWHYWYDAPENEIEYLQIDGLDSNVKIPVKPSTAAAIGTAVTAINTRQSRRYEIANDLKDVDNLTRKVSAKLTRQLLEDNPNLLRQVEAAFNSASPLLISST